MSIGLYIFGFFLTVGGLIDFLHTRSLDNSMENSIMHLNSIVTFIGGLILLGLSTIIDLLKKLVPEQKEKSEPKKTYTYTYDD